MHEMGYGIAIDDFGTGYSSLSHLKELPANVIKIDRSFIKGLSKGSYEYIFLEYIVKLAHIIHLKSAWRVWRQKKNLIRLCRLHRTIYRGIYSEDQCVPVNLKASILPHPKRDEHRKQQSRDCTFRPLMLR